jgi:LacI family transcriptional regulator
MLHGIVPTERYFARELGYKRALEEAGIPVDPSLVVTPRESDHVDSIFVVEELVAAALEKDPAIDGIFASNDRYALGAVHAVEKFGLVVGTDVLVAGYDDSLYSRLATPAITTVSHDTEKAAEAACEILLAMIEGDRGAAADAIVIPGSLIPRGSTLGPDCEEQPAHYDNLQE